MTVEAGDFGRQIGRQLAERRANDSAGAQAAKFIEGIFAEYPQAKLPAILRIDGVASWMASFSVTEGHLREALRVRRKAAKSELDDAADRTPVKRARRQNSVSSKVATPQHSRAEFDFDDGMVPNRRD